MPTIIGWIRGIGKDRIDLTGIKDDQTVKWRNDALDMSEKILLERSRHSETINKLRECRKRMKGCKCEE